jgi:hypothetical protein
MSKRKREIKKRKKLLEETRAEEDLLTAESAGEMETYKEALPEEPDPGELIPSESPVDDSQIVSTPAPRAVKRPAEKKETPARQPKAATATDSWFGQNKENFLLGLLILYVLLLGLGTVGELFEIEWILNLPLFR